MADVEVERADAAGAAGVAVLPEGPVIEDAEGVGGEAERRRVVSLRIAAARVSREPEIVVGEATIQLVLGITLDGVDDGGSGRSAIVGDFIGESDYPVGQLGGSEAGAEFQVEHGPQPARPYG